MLATPFNTAVAAARYFLHNTELLFVIELLLRPIRNTPSMRSMKPKNFSLLLPKSKRMCITNSIHRNDEQTSSSVSAPHHSNRTMLPPGLLFRHSLPPPSTSPFQLHNTSLLFQDEPSFFHPPPTKNSNLRTAVDYSAIFPTKEHRNPNLPRTKTSEVCLSNVSTVICCDLATNT